MLREEKWAVHLHRLRDQVTTRNKMYGKFCLHIQQLVIAFSPNYHVPTLLLLNNCFLPCFFMGITKDHIIRRVGKRRTAH